MNQQVRQLFHELADLPRRERERILDERTVPPELRAELESLLSFDSGDESLTGRVASVAETALCDVETRQSGMCGPYRLVRLLGSGGMGAVYLAERSDGEIQQQVAVKLLRAGAHNASWRDRFLRERQLLAWLNHPAIARLLDAGRLPAGQPYLVMEYVDGAAIDVWCEGKDLRDVLTLFLRVCDGVSHAHRHLIIHRDLKPSNILVDAAARPKLLDFGIAKLLDETADATVTVERLLTPNYASPEQLRGGVQTTATDVYSLGAVLHKLLKGGTPREAATQVRLPDDIDCILRKALRDQPGERYASAEALANDIRRYLEWRPVEARSGDAWYRTRRFLRRYWLPISAAAVTATGLSFGIYTANHERAIAQRRFVQVRQLANRVLSLDDLIVKLPGSTKLRHEIVAMSGEYLDALRTEARGDRELSLEVSKAFVRLAHAQGVPTASNLGQHAQAAESLNKANALVEPLAIQSPPDRAALLTSAEIAHDRMILADTNRRLSETLAHARTCAARVEALIGLGNLTKSEGHDTAHLLVNVALGHKNQHRYVEAVRYAQRALELEGSHADDRSFQTSALSIIADARRQRGDLAGALEAIQRARAIFGDLADTNNVVHRNSLFSALWREGVIMGEAGTINLGRTEEAITVLTQASDLAEGWAAQDPNDSTSRLRLANAARKLGDILRERDPQRAVAVYDHAIVRLGEIKASSAARRQEADLLASASYPLRRMGRPAEAEARIDAALGMLRESKLWPAAKLEPGGEVDTVLRAQADHVTATGQPEKALQLHRELLEKLMASQPNPGEDLRHASRFSDLYTALAALERHAGRKDQADAFSARRLEIWRQWNARLPAIPYIRQQFEAAAKP